MEFQAWLIFAGFWVIFVTTPGPNAVNCITNGMTHGFRSSLWGVAGIVTQATLFLFLSAFGITALIAASPAVFFWVKIAGAAFLIYLGIRGWIMAGRPVPKVEARPGSIYLKALMIATFNAKTVAGYLAAFSQFVQPGVPIWDQMLVIVPTALTLTTLSYVGYTALGAAFGASAIATAFSVVVRRSLAVCFVAYGVALGGLAIPGRG